MELTRKYIALSYGYGYVMPVVTTPRYTVRILWHTVVAVGKIESGMIRDTLPKRMIERLIYLAPAHVRHFEAFAKAFARTFARLCNKRVREALDLPGENTEAIHTIVLFTVIKEHLITHTNAKKRPAAYQLSQKLC